MHGKNEHPLIIRRPLVSVRSKVLKVVRLGEMDADQTVDSVREAELLSNLHNEHIVKVKFTKPANRWCPFVEPLLFDRLFSSTRVFWKAIACVLSLSIAKVAISISASKN